MSRVPEHAEHAPRLRRTRFVCVSDTHNQTPKLPAGDVLLHAGDLTNQGSLTELRKAVDWLEKAPFEAKIVVAGNHDITLDAHFYEQKGCYFHSQHPQNVRDCVNVIESAPSITYLRHESRTIRLTDPKGPQTQFSIFASPFSPGDGDWAFQYDRADGQELWDAIPLDTDIVMTHTPPQYHCDTSARGMPDGCAALRNALWRVRPSLAVCGHRHEGRGVERVRWKIDLSMVSLLEAGSEVWTDPGAGNNKQSLVDLSSKGRTPIDNSRDRGACTTRNRVAFSAPESPTPASATGRPSSFRDYLNPRKNDEAEKDSVEQVVVSRLDQYRVEALEGRLGRKETCVINAAIMAQSYGRGAKRFNKPIVVDIDLPTWIDGAKS